MKNPFHNKGSHKENILSLTPREAFEAIEQGALYVDLRDSGLTDYKIPDVPDIFLLPYRLLANAYQKLPRDRYLILADASGLKSREAVVFLREKGFENMAQMAGGLVEWEKDGFPIREDVKERLTGACPCQLKPRDHLN